MNVTEAVAVRFMGHVTDINVGIWHRLENLCLRRSDENRKAALLKGVEIGKYSGCAGLFFKQT
jgi:hypothetical protein